MRFLFQLLQFFCLLAAAGFALAFLYVAAISLFYPFPLEWMEGHTIDIMQRILDGKPVYVEPSLEYVPYLYTPYYFYVSAFVSLFTGVDFLAARLVSLLATLGMAGILYAWIRREGGSRIIGLITAGLFLATYHISGRWFDVARVDSFYLFLMLAGLYVYYFARHRFDHFLAALLFAAAFFTKQLALLALLPSFLAALCINRKRALQCGLTTLLLIAGGCTYLQISSGGWFSFYTYDIPAGHWNDTRQISLYWTRDMLPNCLGMLGLAVLALVFICYENTKKGLWYAALVLGFVGSAYLSRIHSFGHVNVLMPGHLALVLLSGLALVYAGKKPLPGIAICAVIAAQFFALRYDPAMLTPTPEAEERGQQFIKEIANIPGDVLFSELQFIQSRAGKKTYSTGMAGYDILRADLGSKSPVKLKYQQSIKDAMHNQRFAAIVMSSHFSKILELKGNYRLQRTINQSPQFAADIVNSDTAQIFVPVSELDN